jgi:hypothetical protein
MERSDRISGIRVQVDKAKFPEDNMVEASQHCFLCSQFRESIEPEYFGHPGNAIRLYQYLFKLVQNLEKTNSILGAFDLIQDGAQYTMQLPCLDHKSVATVVVWQIDVNGQ